jgi:hypothetical protein
MSKLDLAHKVQNLYNLALCRKSDNSYSYVTALVEVLQKHRTNKTDHVPVMTANKRIGSHWLGSQKPHDLPSVRWRNRKAGVISLSLTA